MCDHQRCSWEERYRYLETELEAMMLGVADAMEKIKRSGVTDDLVSGVRVVIERTEDSLKAVFLTEGHSALYWFELFHNDLLVDSTARSYSNSHQWQIAPGGRYRVEAFAVPVAKPRISPISMSSRLTQEESR
ncbi:hypothetical protein [Intrasporangium sp. DVR]|uniref:hypothetical protein n=1 Tax=Intrasporangium sp. DVR TaxID=3127867 RepID=UPI00313A5043